MRNEGSRSNPSAFPAGLHSSCHVLSGKGSVMNTTNNMMNLKPSFYVTLRGTHLLYTFCTVWWTLLKDMTVCNSHLLVYKLIPEVELVSGLSWKKNSREHARMLSPEGACHRACKNSELWVLYKKIIMFHLSFEHRIFVWDRCDKIRIFHLRFMHHFYVLGGERFALKL